MAWYNASWDYRIKLTIESDKVAAAVTGDAFLIDLSNMDSDFFDNVQNGGADIRITEDDGETELCREVVSCNTGTDTGEVWFKYASELSNGTDTDIYVYYGNAEASDYATDATYGAQNVWTKDYMGVWHMELDGSTIINSVNEGSNSDITETGTNTSATGQIGNGVLSAAGAGNYMDINDHAEILVSSAMTFVCWSKYTDNLSTPCRKDDGSGREYYMSASRAADGELRWTVKTGGTFAGVESTDTTPANGSYHHLVGTLNDSDTKRYFYVDGSEDAASPTSAVAGTIPDTSEELVIGNSHDRDEPAITLDEVKLLDADWSANDITTHYNNEKANDTWFGTWGTQEAGAATPEATGFMQTGKYWGM